MAQEKLIVAINYWHWFGLGLLLLIIELVSSTTYFLWIALGAALTGLLAFIWPSLPWAIQCFFFAACSIAWIFVGLKYFKKPANTPNESDLNQRNRQYINRHFTLAEPIINGRGQVKVDDTVWRIAGEDLPAGTRIKVVDVDGVILLVEKLDSEVLARAGET